MCAVRAERAACVQVPDEAIDIEGRIVSLEDAANAVCAAVDGPVTSVGTVVSSTREDGRAPRPRPTDPGRVRELIRRGIYHELVAVEKEIQTL